MGQRLPTLSAAFAALALALGAGCAGPKMWGKEGTMAAQGVPSAPLSPQVRGDNGIVQASASSPVAGGSSWSAPFAKLTGKGSERKVQATSITMLWRNHVDYLPDHTHNGQMGAGLAGQLFLFGPGMQFVQPEGKLIIALYDETPRPVGQPANLPEGWEFDKDTLKSLVTADERFGKCYALFLPWPTFRHDVTRIRIAARYEPENGQPLYATEMRITLDNSAPGTNNRVEWTEQVVPGVQPGMLPQLNGSPIGAGGVGTGGSSSGPPPGYGSLQPPPPGYGSLQPVPPGYGSLQPVPPGGMNAPGGAMNGGAINPASLPPFATILHR